MTKLPHTDSPVKESLNSNIASSLSLAVVIFRSIKNKQTELQAFLVAYNVNIIIGTESHLDSSVLNPETFPSHYQVYRRQKHSWWRCFCISR